MVPRVLRRRSSKYPALAAQSVQRNLGDKFNEVKYRSHGDEVTANKEIRSDETLQNKQTNRERQGYRPKENGIRLEKLVQSRQIIFEVAR